MRSREIFVLLAAVGALTVPAAFPAFGTQYNPTYGPSPSNLYWDFGCTAGSLVADWPLTGSGGSAGTTFADASGNGNTATLYGTDTLTSTTAMGYPAAPVGGGIYFNGLVRHRQLPRRPFQRGLQRHGQPHAHRVGLFP